jgi:hypothetical protein
LAGRRLSGERKTALLASGLAANAQSHGLTGDDKRLLAWFQHLDLAPDLSHAPLVRVSRPASGASAGDASRYLSLGFLLNETATTFTVFRLSGRSVTWARVEGASSQAATFERLDLAALASETIAWAPVGDDEPDYVRRISGTWMTEREIFVLAAGCAAAHLDQSAHDLIALGQRISRDQDDYRLSLADFFGMDAMVAAFDGYVTGADRLSVQRQLEWIERKLPGFDEFGLVHDTIATLGPMIKEDARRAQHPVRIEPLTGRDKVRALIDALRDQTGQQQMNPGPVQFVVTIFGSALPPSSASALVDLGYAAVPDLIETLTDVRLTRAVYRRNGIPRSVITIGECVDDILELISGRSFRAYLESGERDPRASQAKANAWWHDLQTRGERLVLIDGTLSGHDGQASQLAARYPQDAVTVIPQAIPNVGDQYTRARMIAALASLRGGDEVAPLRALLNASDPSSQLAVARALTERGYGDEALDAMIRAWDPAIEPGDFSGVGTQIDLAEFLATSGGVRGIAALGSRWRGRHYDVRHGTPPTTDDRWACSYVVIVGREALYAGEDNIPANGLFGPSLVRAIDQALRSATTSAFEIRIGCRRLAER